MNEALLDHLWQSTVFACAAALLTLAFRKDAAGIRFKILLTGSLKFLVPFPLLVLLGEHLRWGATPTASAAPQWSLAVNQIMHPAWLAKLNFGPMIASAGAAAGGPGSGATAAASHWSLAIGQWDPGVWMLIIWSIGFAVLRLRWLFQWMKLRAVVALAVPLDIEAPIPVRETATTLEPGLCGIFAPVLLLPRGIAERLTSDELDSVLEHELCHWWRRDNLSAALHMLVEALFWFHPLVWWLSSRLVVERERACDEEVIQSGTERQVYADAILKVCRSYFEPPLLCATGVSGGTLKQRIEDIMTHQVVVRLHLLKKGLLSAAALAAIAGPVAIGLALGPQGLAQAQEETAGGAMRHYQNTEWNFGLDIPTGWNRFPPNLAQSPREIMRFASGQNGKNLLIIFRNYFDAQKGFSAYIAADEQGLEKQGFTHFLTGESTVGARHVMTLDFDKTLQDGSTWSSHQYFFIEGTLLYTLSFGTTNKPDGLVPLQDRIAKTFSFDATN